MLCHRNIVCVHSHAREQGFVGKACLLNYDDRVQLMVMAVVVVVALLFYIHGKHLRSCRDGQLT